MDLKCPGIKEKRKNRVFLFPLILLWWLQFQKWPKRNTSAPFLSGAGWEKEEWAREGRRGGGEGGVEGQESWGRSIRGPSLFVGWEGNKEGSKEGMRSGQQKKKGEDEDSEKEERVGDKAKNKKQLDKRNRQTLREREQKQKLNCWKTEKRQRNGQIGEERWKRAPVIFFPNWSFSSYVNPDALYGHSCWISNWELELLLL